MDEFEKEIDKSVNDIISQLKSKSNSLKKVEKEKPDVTKEELETFIINNASEVVGGCVDMINDVKDEISLAPGDSRLIESAATLVNAFASAIDALSKLKLSDDKIKAQKEIKQMDIDAKVTKDEPESRPGALLTREEIMKLLKPEEKDPIIEV